MKKSTCGELSNECLICKKKITKHRVMQITMLHSVDETKETKLASFKYSVPLCDEHNGRGINKEQVRVKLAWEQDEQVP